jgi:nitrite reductase/ring-hydroxylating ferredoxin subunit
MSWRDLPNAPPAGTVLCRTDDIPANNGVEFSFGGGDLRFRLVLFRVDSPITGGVRAYLNVCPHFNIPYCFQDDVFCVYEIDGRRDLMCAHHTAMFHLDDGHCYDGPCQGAALTAIDIKIDADRVFIA